MLIIEVEALMKARFSSETTRELGGGGVWRVGCSLSDLEVLGCGESNSGCEEGLWG